MENAEQEIEAESPPKPVDRAKSGRVFNWQQGGWPKFAFDRAAARDKGGNAPAPDVGAVR